jgi:hypothetical protein
MANHIRRTPRLLGVPSQSLSLSRRSRLILSDGPLDDEDHHDFSQYPAYEYLPIQSHQIRLLTLCGGRPQEPLLCRLQVLDFSEIRDTWNTYNALSYSCKLLIFSAHHVIFPESLSSLVSRCNAEEKPFRGQRRSNPSHPRRGGDKYSTVLSFETELIPRPTSTTRGAQLQHRNMD